jgi:hypothetical protein
MIFSAFWAANAILLVALFAGGDSPKKVVGVTLSFVGLLLCLVWYQTQWRALYHLKDRERLMRDLEALLRVPTQLSLSHMLVAGEHPGTKERWLQRPRARTLLPICSAIAAIMWLIALAIVSHFG